MNWKQTGIMDLSVDVLRYIMILLAKSSDGADSFARATSVCKEFVKCAKDPCVLKAVCFDGFYGSEYDGSFWQINGLLCKCARAGNKTACNILLKYLHERVETTKEKQRAVDSAVKDLCKKYEAAMAVNTRLRKQAARLAGQRVMQMVIDLRKDTDEIVEQLDSINHAAINWE